MAILPMKHIEIIAMQKDAKKIVELLQRLGTVDVTERDTADVTDDLSLFPTRTSLNQLEKTSQSISHAISLVEEYSTEKKPFLSGFAGREALSLDEFAKRADKIDETMKVVYDIEALDRKIASETTVRTHTQHQLDAILPWEKLDIPMQYTGSQKTSCIVGQFADPYTDASFYEAFCQQYSAMKESEAVLKGKTFSSEELVIPAIYSEIVYTAGDQTCICIMTHKKDYEDVLATLRRMSFIAPSDPTKHPPEVRISRLRNRIKEATETIADSRKKLSDYTEYLDDLYFLSDYIVMRQDKYEMLGQLLFSKKTFILDGFVAAEDLENVEKTLTSKFDLVFESRDPYDDEEVPVKFHNNDFTSAVEDIVESYSAPSRTDIDPNPVMAFFYYFFFGMMLSDAGYGILMMLGTLFVLKKRKPEGNNRKNMLKFLFCGMATTFWGFIYGSFFGDVVGVVSENFFHHRVDLRPIWFDPSKEPMRLLILSFVLGLVHILLGLGAKFYRMWKNGDKVGAFCEVGCWYLVFAGVFIFILPMLTGLLFPGYEFVLGNQLNNIGIGIAIAGAAGLILTGGRESKGIIGKIIGGFASIYGVTGFFSDLLSYSRLMALGLVTGIVGSVANSIGTLYKGDLLIIKLPLFLFVFLFFHSINMAISALGAYVHVNRLQYVEFFTKFYDGGGKMFRPFTGNTKHFKIKEDN
ncbi:MAG: V-type ATP synthase subunit I [Clostridiales bacterium]|nr:V-type ATP synthase subunit I [Clostridiales bacterium]